jgi:hypothetical protein
MLRPARLSLVGEQAVRISVPPGSPVLERLGKPTARRSLEAAMSGRLGRTISIEFATVDAPDHAAGSGRITAETARRDRLKRLVEEEPLLAAAVQAWDLELID